MEVFSLLNCLKSLHSGFSCISNNVVIQLVCVTKRTSKLTYIIYTFQGSSDIVFYFSYSLNFLQVTDSIPNRSIVLFREFSFRYFHRICQSLFYSNYDKPVSLLRCAEINRAENILIYFITIFFISENSLYVVVYRV